MVKFSLHTTCRHMGGVEV